MNSRLIVFPSDRKEFLIPLPLTLRYIAFGASGQSLYVTAFKRLEKSFTMFPGLFKIDLSQVRASPVPGLDGFFDIDRFAVSRSEDMIIFGGARGEYGSGTCGIYQLNLTDGNLRPVIQTTDCRAGSPWRVFDVSSTAQEALISSNHRLALLDLANGTITPLGSELMVGSYSPDGKWIAAVELHNPKPSRLILIDRMDFSRRRDIGESNNDKVAWSPDSRLLLDAAYRGACPSQNPIALETLEIETGKKVIIKNSICNAGAGRDFGWVSNKIAR